MEQDPLLRATALAGLGVAAGLLGALAMTLSQKAEMALDGRKPSDTPAKAVEAATGREVPDAQKPQVSSAAHYALGAGLGLGLAALEGLPPAAQAPLFLAGAWSAGNGLAAGLGAEEPPTGWDSGQLVTDLAHHAVYAGAATAAFLGLRRLAGV